MSISRSRLLSALAATLSIALGAGSAVAYTPVPVSGTVVPGPGMLPADMVWGKEYSHDIDVTGGPGAPVSDPEQVILWNGGGDTADGIDYSFTRPNDEHDRQVDALANSRDALYSELLRDAAGLAFSYDDEIYGATGVGLGPIILPSAGPLTTASGVTLAGAGELSIEYAGAFTGPMAFDTWATQPEIDARLSPLDTPMPIDVDGVEVWGPEPGDNAEDFRGDADKYSLEIDSFTGFSIWNASGTPYLPHAAIVDAVETLLGPAPDEAFSFYDEARGRDAINLDALMVQDIVGSTEQFDFEGRGVDGELIDQEHLPIEPARQGDSIVFSIRQMPLPGGGYYATGSELFVLDSTGTVEFLKHGEHIWDSAFALSELTLEETFIEETEQEIRFAVLDINAIEAIGDIRDEPVGLPGDYNGDGKVDAADFTVWRNSEGDTGLGLAADGNGDGTVDSDDYAVWKGNYGAMAPAPAMAMALATSAAVPEPATVLLVGIGIFGITAGRRG